jgi:type IV pilus assembly protein PilB
MKSVRDICAILLENNLIQDSHIKLIESDYQKDSMHDLYASILKVVPSLTMGSIMTALSKFYSIPVLDISMFNLSSIPENILSNAEMVDNKWIPLSKHNGRLKLAVADPSDFSAVKQLSFKLNLAIDLVLVNGRHMESVFNQNSSQYFKTIDFGDESLDGVTTDDDAQDTSEMVNSGDDDQPIVKFVHKIIFDAVKSGASDIHFEPYEKTYRVRYRIDGVLSEVVTPPQGFKDKIAARIKVVSKLDIAEKRIPQDGRLRLSISQNQVIDFRVSTLPTAFGEKIVLRILDKSSASLGIEALGFDPTQEKIILDTIYRPYGMALVTGPTGSGKTVTLYSCLNLLNEADRNISTAEDPIEIPIAGINQVAINEKTGMQFGVALRAFLRQDPDVIMVGEIRDKDTAEMAHHSCEVLIRLNALFARL